MDSNEILKRLKLIETFRLDIGNQKSAIFTELKLITDRDNQYFSAGADKSNIKYVGQVGSDFFNIKPCDKYYSQMDISAYGKIVNENDKDELEIEIDGFHKKWVIQFPIMFLFFAIIVLMASNTTASWIFLCVGFVWMSFSCVLIMRFGKKLFKNRLIKNLNVSGGKNALQQHL